METQETQEKPALGFVPNRLPWIVAVTVLLLYAITLNYWARLDSLIPLSTATGWSVYLTVRQPLLHLLALPFRLLPMEIQAPALNLCTALMAALTLALLARSVALLPYDRTREARLRERSEFSLLSLPLAWLPAVLACALAGLQLSFWEHATAFTGEMLDLLLFAYLIRCLLEFRIDRRERWLIKLAFVYGLAVTNNYAMIAFFPGFLIAVAWVKSWEFLNPRFLLRMVAAGVAGLSLYLYLPLVNTWGGEQVGTFWEHLRTVLATQWGGLRSAPVGVVLLLCLTSIVPLFLLSVRWSSESPGTSAAGATVAHLLVRLLQVILVLLCLSVFFETRLPFGGRMWGSRFGVAFLPFYYLAALNVGYFAGYFLLLNQPVKGHGWPLAPNFLESLGKVVPAFAVAVLLAAPTVLVWLNWRPVAAANSPALGQFADQMIAALPPQGAYVLSDGTEDLLLLEARLRHTRGVQPHVMIYAGWLEFANYHERLARRYPERWTVPAELSQPGGLPVSLAIMAKLASLAMSNEVYYANPSFGYYFEVARLTPRGPIFRTRVLDPAPLIPPPLPPEELTAARRFWESSAPTIESLVTPAEESATTTYLRGFYSRALNYWAVTLQRHGDVAGAARWLDLAWRLRPENLVVRVNRAYNAELRREAPPEGKASGDIEFRVENWDRVLRLNGPFDQPRWTLQTGTLFALLGLYRQALAEFDRTLTLAPTNTLVQLWKENMEVMTRLRLGDPTGAEKQALDLQQRFPKEDIAFEALTQVYLATGRLTNALANVNRQLELTPTNVNALLNKAAYLMQLGQFPQAIPPLDTLLALQPQNQAAKLNRAIAQFQDHRLDEAERDYRALVEEAPQAPAVLWGLAEIAYRRTNHVAALSYYRKYLEFGPRGTDEYKAVEARVEELRRAAKPR